MTITNNPPYITKPYFTTPLHSAVKRGTLEDVQNILQTGTKNLEARGYANDTPLTAAAQRGNLDIVKYLVERGADINAQGNGKMTALHWALQHGYTEVANYLMQQKDLKLDTKDQGGASILHTAAYKGNADIVKQLVERDVSIDERDNKGRTPLDIAQEQRMDGGGDYDSIISLLTHEAKQLASKKEQLASKAAQLTYKLMNSYLLLGNVVSFTE